MHILVVNDDGPPSSVSSPYVHSFVDGLQKCGHTVSVVLPHCQRSWIGKAHIVGQTVTPTYFRPGTLHHDDGTTHARPREDGGEEWILVDGTPASCAQIGLHYYFKEKGKIDLVVSGPNYGRNSTALFALSSGTVGGALEAAVCGTKAIALSYAFFSRNHDPDIIAGATRMATRLIEYLHENWQKGVDFYSVNIPLIEGVDGKDTKVLYTHMLSNYWSSASCFVEVDVDDEMSPEETEAQIRESEEQGTREAVQRVKHKKFKWEPKLDDVLTSVAKSEPGNDGLTVSNGAVSVTPLRANFMHHDGLIGKEIKLHRDITNTNTILDSLHVSSSPKAYAIVDYSDSTNYVRPKILYALSQFAPTIKVVDSLTSIPNPGSSKIVHWSDYEKIPFEDVVDSPQRVLSCSYIIRKALIRKHHLSSTVHHHITKHPSSSLSRHFPLTFHIELDYAEFLDEALDNAETYELTQSLDSNSSLPLGKRKYWILKPGMSDRGQGIRLFSTLEDLAAIFESFDPDEDEGEDEDEEGEKEGVNGVEGDGVMTSHLRHFVLQEYIHPPLLTAAGNKFHVRTYVLCAGALKVWVFEKMLQLSASSVYVSPHISLTNLSPHLTNTCFGGGDVELFQDDEMKETIYDIMGELFLAAAKEQRIHFQVLPNAFEVFGVDFVVSEGEGKGGRTKVYVLEVNAYPDFGQTGDALGDEVIGAVMRGVVGAILDPWAEGKGGVGVEGEGMRLVADERLGGW